METFPSGIPVIKSKLGPQLRPKWLLAFVLRFIVGNVFLFAGVLKAINPDEFIEDLRRLYILPEELLAPAAAFIPYLEIVVGVALILRIFYRSALLLSGGLLIAFGIVLVSAMARGLDITCGCFGKGLNSSATTGLMRDCLLLFFWTLLVWIQRSGTMASKQARSAIIR